MAKFDLDDLVQLAGLLNNKEKEEKSELESLLDSLGTTNKKDNGFDLGDLSSLLGSKEKEPDLTTLVTLLGKTKKKEENNISLSALAGLLGNSKKEETFDAADLLNFLGKKEEKKEEPFINPEMLAALLPILSKIAKDADLADKIKDLLTDDKKKTTKKKTPSKTGTKKKTTAKKTTAKKATTKKTSAKKSSTKKSTTTKKSDSKKSSKKTATKKSSNE